MLSRESANNSSTLPRDLLPREVHSVQWSKLVISDDSKFEVRVFDRGRYFCFFFFFNEKRTMLCASSDQGENNGAIVSQMTNPHTPQDFTVSRLLSTPTNSLGKNPRNSRSKTRMSKRLRNGNGRESNAIRDRFTERERDRETRVGPRLTRFHAFRSTNGSWFHRNHAFPVMLFALYRFDEYPGTVESFKNSHACAAASLLDSPSLFLLFFFVKAQLPCLGRHLEIFHSNFHLPSNSV